MAKQSMKSDFLAFVPFSVDDVYLFLIQDHASSDTQYIACKKQLLDQKLLAYSNKSMGGLVFFNDNHRYLINSRCLAQLSKQTIWKFIQSRISVILFATLFILLCGTIAHDLFKMRAALINLNHTVQMKELAALKLSKTVNLHRETHRQKRAYISQKLSNISSVEFLEELTAIIPDTTWITDLDFQHSKLKLSGYSKDSASLISLLLQSKFIIKAEFTNPVIRTPGQLGERFTLKAVIGNL